MKPHILICAAIAFVFLTGFGYQLTNPTTIEQPQFTLVDKVPPWQKEQKFSEGSNTRDCLWGANRVGDKKLPVDRITYLRNQLAGRGNPALAGKTLVVLNFTIHKNSGYYTRKLGQGGLIPDAINKEPKECSTDDLFGSYGKAEADPEQFPIVLVVVLDIEVDGRTLHFRKIKPFEKNTLDEVLTGVVDDVLAAAKSDLPG